MSAPVPAPASSLHRACPQCGKLAVLGRRFCGGCRAVLVRPCAACGFGNERDDLWCGGCGAGLTRVAASPPAASPPRVPAVPAIPPRVAASPAPPTARERPAAAVVNLTDLLAINARRAPLVGPSDATDQDDLDLMFGESR